MAPHASLVLDPLDPDQWIPAFALPSEIEMNLACMPMPPTSNNMYATYQGRRIKSREFRLWERDVQFWALQHAPKIAQLKQILPGELGPGKVMSVDCTFWFPYEKLVSKQGKPKRIDASNRIKATHDALASLIGIDDCYFWRGSFEKRIAHLSPARVDIRLGIVKIE